MCHLLLKKKSVATQYSFHLDDPGSYNYEGDVLRPINHLLFVFMYPTLKLQDFVRAGDVTQGYNCLPRMQKALHPIHNTASKLFMFKITNSSWKYLTKSKQKSTIIVFVPIS